VTLLNIAYSKEDPLKITEPSKLISSNKLGSSNIQLLKSTLSLKVLLLKEILSLKIQLEKSTSLSIIIPLISIL
jgi:hypothetical protein